MVRLLEVDWQDEGYLLLVLHLGKAMNDRLGLRSVKVEDSMGSEAHNLDSLDRGHSILLVVVGSGTLCAEEVDRARPRRLGMGRLR